MDIEEVITRDIEAGLTETAYLDDGTLIIESSYDAEPLIEQNKALFNCFDERTPFKGEWHRVASIPLNLYFDLYRKGIIQDQRALRKWLNDPDNRFFRTRPGVV